jgi:two-component system, OmpR family, sensor kinase
MASIRARLTLWYTGVLVVVLVVAAVAVAVVQERLALQRLDDDLRRSLLTLEGVMRTEFDEGLDLPAAAAEARAEVVVPDRTLFIAGEDGAVLVTWGLPIEGTWKPPLDGAAGLPVTVTAGSHPVRLLARQASHRQHRYIAAVAGSLTPLARQRDELRTAAIAAVLVALSVGALGGWIVGRQTLRPLGAMARQATLINERTTGARLHVSEAHDELDVLATAFNGLLGRLGTALDQQRQFMADASHELRTPVSVVRTTAQVTLAREARGEFEYRESLAIVGEQAARLSRLVDAMFLLSRAEAEGVPLHREAVYLDDIAEETARALRVLASERQVGLAVDGDEEVAFVGDDGLLRQLVSNLLHNAIRFAKPAGTVRLSVGRSAETLTIRVIDDGPGIAADQHERIFERFVRDPKSGGAGLGLPIARWIAEAHEGRLWLESGDPGRTCFIVSFPAAPVSNT